MEPKEPTSNPEPMKDKIGKVCDICRSSAHTTSNHSEKGESGIEFVSVEKLIPGINTEGLYNKERDYADNFRDEEIQKGRARMNSHRNQETGYAAGIEEFFNYASEDKEENVVNLEILNRLKDQVVIDLGAGDTGLRIYYSITEIGARGYVGVDLSTRNSERLKSNLAEDSWVTKDYPKEKLIPAVVVNEDMLTFLKRLPNKSVSIIASGLSDGILPEIYEKDVEQEIKRVLDPKGVMFVEWHTTLYVEGIHFKSLSAKGKGTSYGVKSYINIDKEQKDK